MQINVFPPFHSDSEHIEIGMLVVGHSLIRSSIRSFARTAHSFACSALLASLARSAALTHSPLSSWDSRILLSIFQGVLNHCAQSA